MAAAMAAASCSFPLLPRRSHSSRRCSSLAVSSSSANHPRRHLLLRRPSPSASEDDGNNEAGTLIKRRISRKEGAERAVASDIKKHESRQMNMVASISKLQCAKKKDRRRPTYDLKDQEVLDSGVLHGDSFLNAVVKVYCTHAEPDYSLPWQKQRQYTSTGSAFMIGDGKLLTNAHCVQHYTQVKVKRRGDATKFVAKVLATGVECDIALLSVENEEFWKGVEPLRFGHLPDLQDAVTVVGYPVGGDTISVTKGVVSRIEVTSYSHGSCDLLSIQIDAALNPGNSGGPAFNDQGECIGVAFEALRSDEVENIGYVIPTTVVSHFLDDYKRNNKYTGFPSLGILLQTLENPALRAWLRLPSDRGILIRRIEPTSPACNILKEGDVILSFDNVPVGNEGTVPFRTTERIGFRYLISQKFCGDMAELGIIRNGEFMKVKMSVLARVHLVPYHIEGGHPSYLIVAGLVFTPLSEPLIAQDEDSFGLKLLVKARHASAKFEGEQIVILSQVLADEVNIGYENMDAIQVLQCNGKAIKNIHHLAHLIDSCQDEYLRFTMESNLLVVLDRKAALAASSNILAEYGIPSERSSDLLEPYIDPLETNHSVNTDIEKSLVSNLECNPEVLLWV